MKYLRLMRIHHYIKNLLIFAALACSGRLFQDNLFWIEMLAFLAFCAVSSSVYIVNDIIDREKDRNHPVKCHRPIASGEVTVSEGSIIAGGCLVIAVICIYFTGVSRLYWWIILYFMLNMGYSFGLKNIPMVDISILVSGFLIRIIYGAVAADITISNWLYLTVIAGGFYFALGKRRNEARKVDYGKTRKVLQAYPVDFLDKNMYMCLALVNVFYALWSMDEKTVSLYHSEYLIFTVPIVLLITMRYSMDLEGNSMGDPTDVLFHDKMLLILCGVYLLLIFSILYII